MLIVNNAEDWRIRSHLEGALEALRAAVPKGLGRAQRRARAEHVAGLEAYARAGRYPRNLAAGGPRRPALVDAFGTRCALAHLVERSGAEELVDHLRALDNHALVRDLAEDAGLLAWLDRAGLSVAEAARIQPSYSPRSSPFLCACSDLRGFVVVGRVERLHESGCEVKTEEIIKKGSSGLEPPGRYQLSPCSASVGARILVTELHSEGGTRPTSVIGRLVDGRGKVRVESCSEGRATSGMALPPVDIELAKLRAAATGEAHRCVETVGGPPGFFPVPEPRLPSERVSPEVPRRPNLESMREALEIESRAIGEASSPFFGPSLVAGIGGSALFLGGGWVAWRRLRRSRSYART